MDPERLLERLCRRHGVDPGDATRLRPLLERALISSPRVRTRILSLIESHLARRSEAGAPPSADSVERELDEEVLVSVARTLHHWSPSQDPGGGLPPGLMPEGL